MSSDHDPANVDQEPTRLRRARAGDIFAISRMMRALAAQQGAELRIGMDQLQQDCFGARRWLDLIVAEGSDGQLVGFAGLQPMGADTTSARGVDLHHLFVAPSARGGGLGEALMNAAEREARKLGAAYLRLTAGADCLENDGYLSRSIA